MGTLYMTDKGLVSLTYKELLHTSKKMMSIPIRLQKGVNETIHK